MFNLSKKILVPFILLFIFVMTVGSLPISYAFADNKIINFDVSNSQTIKISNYQIIPIEKENIYLSTNMGWPVKEVIVSSGWGHRESCRKCSSYHQGTDFVPGEGSDVLAAMNGTVKEVGYADEYGVYVTLEHLANRGEVWETVYAHLEFNSVPKEITVGEQVFIGDKVGTVGDTGLATGPHLHFEIRIDGAKRNPWPILVKNTKQS
jgi:murein DD-endopeptidase MepM/ murein hydrolase activator NlpD